MRWLSSAAARHRRAAVTQVVPAELGYTLAEGSARQNVAESADRLVTAPPLIEPDLHAVLLQRLEIQTEGPGRSLRRDGRTSANRRCAGGVDVPIGARPGWPRDASPREGSIKRLLAGGG